MPDLTTHELTIALAAVAALALVSLIVALVSVARLRRVRKQYAFLRGHGEESEILEMMHRWQEKLNGIDVRIDDVASLLHEHTERSQSALQKLGVVRFDAFEDMGGRLSFSAAFLDGRGDGMVVTSINGRTETLTYAKSIERLASEHNLSDEERDAIARAVAGRKRVEDRPAVSR